MNKHYDNIDELSCQTRISDIQGDYYAFEDTVFFGAKGGQESDQGTINGQEVLDLKWEGDQLYHKVSEPISDPVLMEVNRQTRYINTSVQTTLHYLDGFYNDRGMILIADGIDPRNQWYELDSQDVSWELLHETELFMANVISENVPTTYTYIEGKDYPDPFYQQFDLVRLVHLGQYNSQPCGTPHLNHSGQIGSFTILDAEKTKKGTRVYFAIHRSAQDRFKDYYTIIKDISRLLNTSHQESPQRVQEILQTNKELQKDLKAIKKELMTYQAKELSQDPKVVVKYPLQDRGDLQMLAQSLNQIVTQTKVILSEIDDTVHMAILSPEGQARKLLEKVKDSFPSIKGGGSPKIVTASLHGVQLEDLETGMKSIL